MEFVQSKLDNKVGLKALKDGRLKVRLLGADRKMVEQAVSDCGVAFECSESEGDDKTLVVSFPKAGVRDDQKIESVYESKIDWSKAQYSSKYKLTEAVDTGDREIAPAQAAGDACEVDGKAGTLTMGPDGYLVCVINPVESDDEEAIGADLGKLAASQEDGEDPVDADDKDGEAGDDKDGVTEDHFEIGDEVEVVDGDKKGAKGHILGSTGEGADEIYSVDIDGAEVKLSPAFLKKVEAVSAE
jgi:hypothetical protein